MITLTDREVEIIKMQLDGKIEVWTTDEEIQEVLGGVIDKASDLLRETDEETDDLIQWYYNKYLAQSND